MARQKQQRSHFPDAKIALEEAYRDVWQVLKAHDWELEPELDKDVAETLTALCNSGVTDPRELLHRTLKFFLLAPPN